jgi:ufm1-conjugating enzyme 1
MVDEVTKKTLAAIPLLKTNSGPRDKENWVKRLKEEYAALIKYVSNNKEQDNDWFRLESNAEGTRWFGKCWYIHNMLKYELDVEFDIPVTYPTTSPEIAIPELDGKTAKMYRYSFRSYTVRLSQFMSELRACNACCLILCI